MNDVRSFTGLGSRRVLLAPAMLFLMVAILAGLAPAQEPWKVVGPPGGDARAITPVPGEPRHLYLGTTDSWLYESLDEGATWQRLAKLGKTDGFVLDSIVVDAADASTLYVGGWKDSSDGGLWISHDRGRNWSEPAELKGQPLYALAQARSNPRILFAGTLDGVFRSSDGGGTWERISPAGSKEIHEIESLAIDPANPDIVYVGTWHLPWKTADGGKSWNSIKKGLIVDSDVFSIIIDPVRRNTVYLSACSGIYKSENGGALFRKIQGIPTEARRTRVLMQDPENREVVYAGTTEGLYKTENGGKTFRRMTGPEVVINDVYVDPGDSNKVLLATDRGGVLASTDGGENFTESNVGISERKVAALVVDERNPEQIYAGVVNDKTYGGVFVSENAGKTWERSGAGLDGRDVYALSQSKDGTVLAGTNDGIFILDPPPAAGAAVGPAAGSGASASALTWEPRNLIANTAMKTFAETHYRTRVNVEKQVKVPETELNGRVNALDTSGDVWAAATVIGVLTSKDKGASWQGGPVMGGGEYLSVTVDGEAIAAARADGVALSKDSGQTWWPLGLPTMLTRIHRVVFAPDGTLWLGAREGVYFTRDLGKTWMWIQRLPFRDVDDLSYDRARNRVLVSSRSSDQVFSIDPKTMTWQWWQAGYKIALIRWAGTGMVAASMDDGVLVAPAAAGAESGQK
jgi:photosystem II stability/assembly factor-like uncharacterized protein